MHHICSAQWRSTGFCSFFPSADLLSLGRQGVIGGSFVQLRWALLAERIVGGSASAIGVRVGVSHTGTRGSFAPGRIITGHGMATYIQWRHIPDRSESTSESKCKVYHPRSQSPRTSPVLLSTMPRSFGIQVFPGSVTFSQFVQIGRFKVLWIPRRMKNTKIMS